MVERVTGGDPADRLGYKQLFEEVKGKFEILDVGIWVRISVLRIRKG